MADKVRIKMRYGDAAILSDTDAAIVVAPAAEGESIITIIGEYTRLVDCLEALVDAIHEHGLAEELERAVKRAREVAT